ncbi:MAG TPA: aminotransferase class IV [Hanamia sp.]|nr:aminotransferase class IV [Hanamia sp.]
MDEHFFIYNNQFFRTRVPVITVQNRSFRYGDGLFETMRMHRGRILNLDLHFERLSNGMDLLGLFVPENFSKEIFEYSVNELLEKNFISQHARIRLMIFASEESLFEKERRTNFIIETFPLSEEIEWNEKGLVVDIFPDARKSCDGFSNIKSNNYLSSLMAARFAAMNKLEDALLLNSFERICESSIANIFLVKDGNIFTPPLSEGCVAGIMRRWIFENFPFKIEEKTITTEDLLSADELFLTNSIAPVRWIRHFRNKVYTNKKAREIFEFFMGTI